MKTKRFLGIVVLAGIVILAMGCKNKTNSEVEKPDGHFQGIPVYGNMSATSLTTLNTWFTGLLDDLARKKFKDGITRINIVSGSTASVDGNTLNLGEIATGGTIGSALADIVAHHLYPSNGVYLAYYKEVQIYS